MDIIEISLTRKLTMNLTNYETDQYLEDSDLF